MEHKLSDKDKRVAQQLTHGLVIPHVGIGEALEEYEVLHPLRGGRGALLCYLRCRLRRPNPVYGYSHEHGCPQHDHFAVPNLQLVVFPRSTTRNRIKQAIPVACSSQKAVGGLFNQR